ncbi:MAG: septum site-determining protein MinD [Oscillospiraceae bacterium]|nr:septum site-determining protein MinD [Oscillospiraceae bacterium]
MGEIIALTSGKGGVGKTVITANLGRALTKLKKKVILIDMDIGLRNLDIVLGVEHQIVYDITDVLEGTAELSQALITCKKFNNVSFLPASQTKRHKDISAEKLKELLENLRDKYDYILIDSPTGVGRGFGHAVFAADSVIVVTQPDGCSLRDADKVLTELERFGKDKAKLLINRKNAKFLKSEKVDAKKMVNTLAIELLGVISENKLTAGVNEIAKKI